MFGEMIYKQRKALRLTQKALAKKVGVSVATIRNWERDVSKNPYTTLIKMCQALHIDPNTLLDYSPSADTTENLTEDDRIALNYITQILQNKNIQIKNGLSQLK